MLLSPPSLPRMAGEVKEFEMATPLPQTAPANVLDVANIEVIYNHVILVLKGVSLALPEGRIVALLGANGAGKSTTLKAISNLLRTERGEVTKGQIHCRGERVDGLTPNDLVRRGVIQVMEGRHCFGHLTVEENLLTGAFIHGGKRRQIAEDLEKVYHYFPRLKERRTSQAGYTSGGEQQMTAIGRLCPLRLHPGERPRRARRRRRLVARERGRQGILSRHRRRRPPLVPRRQALPPAQAVAVETFR